MAAGCPTAQHEQRGEHGPESSAGSSGQPELLQHVGWFDFADGVSRQHGQHPLPAHWHGGRKAMASPTIAVSQSALICQPWDFIKPAIFGRKVDDTL